MKTTQDGECVYDDCAHNVEDNVFEEPVYIFYDALHTDIFNDLETGLEEFFDSDGCADSDGDPETPDDTSGLAEWAAEYNISQTALTAFLKILRQKGLTF